MPEWLSILFASMLGACSSVDVQTPQRRIEALIEDAKEVGFAYAAVTDSQSLFEIERGVADAASGARVTPQTQFLSASSTKALTAVAILQLVQAGKLRLDDPLSRYVTYQPYGERVTIAQLLNHSSGVPNPMPLKWLHTQSEHARYDESAALRTELTRHPKLDFAPGERYGYSNLAYWLLGRVIEAVTQQDYATFVRRELLDPLGISTADMSFEISDPAQQARGHVRRWSVLGLVVPLMAESKIMASPHGRWLRLQHLYMNGPAYGGMRATARGYALFLQDLLRADSRLLNAETKRLLLTPQSDNAGRTLPTTLGLHTGQLDGVPYVSKPGGGPGFSSNLRLYPTRQLATVFMSNQMRASEASIQRLSDQLDRDVLASRPH